jgi:hypothetical protein
MNARASYRDAFANMAREIGNAEPLLVLANEDDGQGLIIVANPNRPAEAIMLTAVDRDGDGAALILERPGIEALHEALGEWLGR